MKSPEVTPKSPTTTVKAKEEVKKNKPTLSHSSSSSSHHQHHSEDEDDEEVFFDDLEMSTRDRKGHRVNYSRVVTSSTYNKMCVHRDDLIITSKKLHHRNHQIFIITTIKQRWNASSIRCYNWQTETLSFANRIWAIISI